MDVNNQIYQDRLIGQGFVNLLDYHAQHHGLGGGWKDSLKKILPKTAKFFSDNVFGAKGKRFVAEVIAPWVYKKLPKKLQSYVKKAADTAREWSPTIKDFATQLSDVAARHLKEEIDATKTEEELKEEAAVAKKAQEERDAKQEEIAVRKREEQTLIEEKARQLIEADRASSKRRLEELRSVPLEHSESELGGAFVDPRSYFVGHTLCEPRILKKARYY